MRTLEKFLNDNQPGLNKNSGPAKEKGIFSKLGYNFEHPDPDFMKLTDRAKMHLDRVPKILKDWQAADMRGGGSGILFKNPVAAVVGAIAAYSISYCSVIIDEGMDIDQIQEALNKKDKPNNSLLLDLSKPEAYYSKIKFPELTSVFKSAFALLIVCARYLDHTNRLSNVVPMDMLPANVPHYQLCMIKGKQLMYLCSQADRFETAEPVLGCFTSIYVEGDLTTILGIIEDDFGFMMENIEIKFDAETQVKSYFCYLTEEEVDGISADLDDASIFMENRRKHDESMYNRMNDNVQKYSIYKSINDGGELQRKLIDQYIGTDTLKNKLSQTDAPQNPLYKVTVDYYGKITYTSKDPDRNSFTIPSTPYKEPTINTVTSNNTNTFSGTGNVGDTIIIKDPTKPNTNIGTYTYTGTIWVFNEPTPNTNTNTTITITTPTIEDKINLWANTTRLINVSGTTLALTPGALIYYDTVYGVWSTEKSIKVENIGANNYTYNEIYNMGTPDINIKYTFSNTPNNTIAIGQTSFFNVSTINYQISPNAKFDTIWITPGVDIPYKIVNKPLANGILMPSSISINVGSTTERLQLYKESGPYPIYASSLESTTWKNETYLPVTISNVQNITDSNSASDMTIVFTNVQTPYTLNANSSVLWYANVTPMVEFPNTSTFKVSTEDGQERTITIGIDRGIVDDSYLYNEKVNTNPDIILTNNYFDISVFNGKANTPVTYTGPFDSGTLLLDANGYVNIANNSIDANGIYTWIFEFANTSHKRTLTKVIYS